MSDPDPFVILTLKRQPGSDESAVVATTCWDEMQAHEIASGLADGTRRVWLLDPHDSELWRFEYSRDVEADR